MVERAVAAEKFRAVAGLGGLLAGQIGEGDASAEIAVPRVAREDRPGLRIHFGDDVTARGGARAPSTHST